MVGTPTSWTVYTSGQIRNYSTSWTQSILIPLHKKGNPESPGKYFFVSDQKMHVNTKDKKVLKCKEASLFPIPSKMAHILKGVTNNQPLDIALLGWIVALSLLWWEPHIPRGSIHILWLWGKHHHTPIDTGSRHTGVVSLHYYNSEQISSQEMET